jgi:NDP-sugar pyrophosphorylase family protein
MFFILAGGYGKRAAPLSRSKPKPAFPLGGTPLIALLLQQLRALGCAQGFINLHHLGAQVVSAVDGTPGGRGGVRFVEEEQLSGSLVLRQSLPFSPDWLLAVNGDTFLEIPLAELSRRADDPGIDGVLLARRDESGSYARLRCSGDDFLESVPPGAPAGQGGMMYAGAALFRKSALEKIDEVNFFASIRRHGLRFKVIPYDGIWLDIGTPASYFQANWEYMARSSPQAFNAVSPNVRISPAAQVERSVLWEGTRIGAGVRLRECIVAGGLDVETGAYTRQIVCEDGAFPLS